MSSQAHFRGVLYSLAWVFTLSVSCKAVEGREDEQAEVKHPVFFM